MGRTGFLSVETLTLITSQFLHGGWLHLAGNLLFLWIFANNIEDSLGRLAFLLFYLGGGAVAGLTQVAIDPASTIPMIGASGAIASVLGGYIVLYPRARITSLVFLGFFYQLIDVPADRGARVLVRAPVDRRARVARLCRSGGRRRVLRPHRGLRGRRRGGTPAPDDAPSSRWKPSADGSRGIIRPMPDVSLVEMVVESVRVHMLSSRHVVILKETDRDRYLPIWIGQWEASAIAMKLQGLTPERPLTHDLFASALEAVGARVDRVVVVEMNEETYHARLILAMGERTIEVDARPSDALALAVRTGARIFATVELMDQAGLGEGSPGLTDDPDGEQPLESLTGGVVDPRLDMFRDFVNSLDTDPGGESRTG